MTHHFYDFALYLGEATVTVAAILFVFAGLINILNKHKNKDDEKLEIIKLNDQYEDMADLLQSEILPKEQYKNFVKEIKKNKKEELKSNVQKKHIYVLRFDGDLHASEVDSLREAITAILMIATIQDEVLVILESPGGLVPHYGLVASQLERIRQKNIRLIVSVDKVAASGGYMVACVADKILAAPFAYIGSIGVVIEMPNFSRLLKKNNIDFEQITAGEFKRTLSMFGENTDAARKKVKQDVEDIHLLFKDFIKKHRPQVDLATVATGDFWPAKRALELNLVDDLITSDDYLLSSSSVSNIYEVSYTIKKSLRDRIGDMLQRLQAFLPLSS